MPHEAVDHKLCGTLTADAACVVVRSVVVRSTPLCGGAPDAGARPWRNFGVWWGGLRSVIAPTQPWRETWSRGLAAQLAMMARHVRGARATLPAPDPEVRSVPPGARATLLHTSCPASGKRPRSSFHVLLRLLRIGGRPPQNSLAQVPQVRMPHPRHRATGGDLAALPCEEPPRRRLVAPGKGRDDSNQHHAARGPGAIRCADSLPPLPRNRAAPPRRGSKPQVAAVAALGRPALATMVFQGRSRSAAAVLSATARTGRRCAAARH